MGKNKKFLEYVSKITEFASNREIAVRSMSDDNLRKNFDKAGRRLEKLKDKCPDAEKHNDTLIGAEACLVSLRSNILQEYTKRFNKKQNANISTSIS